MYRFFKQRVRESIALAAVFAASITFHSAWIVSLLISRSESFKEYLTLSDSIGAVSGMYTITVIVYIISFVVGLVWFKGRDCSHFRDRIFWFFLASIVSFIVLTHPIIYEFEISGS